VGLGIGRLGAGFGRLGGRRGVGAAARIVLSANTIAENASLGAVVGTLSVVNATGTPAFTLTDTAGNRFALDGSAIERGATSLNYEAATSHDVVVSVADVTPAIADTTFTILVTNIVEFSTATTANVVEGVALAHTVTTAELTTKTITGGADAARFEFVSGGTLSLSHTLRWLSDGTKDFEAPDDADANNTYVVQVTATDALSNATNQTITVTVTNDSVGPPPMQFDDEANSQLLAVFDDF
jgi:hypothetical protein